VSVVVYRRSYHAAFRERVPYAVGVIDLAEGVRFLSRLVQVAPHAIRCGMEVEVEFEPVADDVVIPVFRPLEGGQP